MLAPGDEDAKCDKAEWSRWDGMRVKRRRGRIGSLLPEPHLGYDMIGVTRPSGLPKNATCTIFSGGRRHLTWAPRCSATLVFKSFLETLAIKSSVAFVLSQSFFISVGVDRYIDKCYNANSMNL